MKTTMIKWVPRIVLGSFVLAAIAGLKYEIFDNHNPDASPYIKLPMHSIVHSVTPGDWSGDGEVVFHIQEAGNRTEMMKSLWKANVKAAPQKETDGSLYALDKDGNYYSLEYHPETDRFVYSVKLDR